MDKETKDAWLKSSNELSPEASTKRKSINQKIFLFGCLPVGLFFVIALLFGIFAGGDIPGQKEEKETDTLSENARYIPGIKPADIYLDLEQQGFTTEKSMNPEFGNLWTSLKQYEGLDCRVNTFSPNTQDVVSVSAYVTIDRFQKSPESAKFLILRLASLPYDGGNPKEAQQWVEKNFNNHQATMIMGEVQFMMLAPSDGMRGIYIGTEYSADSVPALEIKYPAK